MKEFKTINQNKADIEIGYKEQKQHLIDIMKSDEELGLYEEPKQETLEETALRLYPGVDRQVDRMLFINGAKWQKERMYSEEDMIEASKYGYNFHKTTQFPKQEFEDSCIRNTQQWFEQFKKK